MNYLRPATIGLLALAALLILLAAGGTTPAYAVTITVNTTDDELNADGDCSLREAIQAANTDAAVDACSAGSGADTVEVPAGTYTLSIAGQGEDANATGDLDITADLTINGAATTIVDGDALDRVFHVVGAVTVEISGLTIQNGFANSAGGIFNDFGTLTIIDSTISSNTANLNGGGIGNFAGTLTLNSSTVSGNTASSSGGGIGNFGGGTLTLTNSTVSGNTATTSGGVGGGISDTSAGTLTLNSSTVSDNTAGDFGGGIIIDADTTATLKNTIVANSSPDDCSGGITSGSYNLDSDGTCGLGGTGDISSTDPLLGPLADNGGPTQTHALLAGSPAIEAGSPDCPPPATDQRGVARPQGTACDIGAYELEGSDFTDVRADHWAVTHIQAIFDAGITTGCSADPLLYCPNDPVTRAQMAAFLLRAMGHADHLPAYQGYFSDVPSGLWFTGFVEHLFEHNVTGGCATDPLRYCPDDSVSRAQMAAFLLRGIDEADHLPPYQDYFDDVAAGLWFTGFVEHLSEHAITLGCSVNPPLYCPFKAVTRAQMAAFIVRAFELLPP